MEDSVLFVDDEQNMLSALKRMLFDESYERYFALSGEEALALLATRKVKVIISDMRMPGMDGVAFLEKARTLVPDSVRIILSGQSDMVSVMNAVNRGGIWRFISKPWNDDDIKCTIRNAFELHSMHAERERLLTELTVKNEQLEAFNRNLEVLVSRRTCLIEAQKRLLHEMIEGSELKAFARSAVLTVAGLAGTDDVTLLHAIGEKEFIRYDAQAPDSKQKEALLASLINGTSSHKDGFQVFPVVNAGSVLGALGVGKAVNDGDCHIDEVVESIVPIVALSLGQFKMIADAPAMLDALDDFIDNL